MFLCAAATLNIVLWSLTATTLARREPAMTLAGGLEDVTRRHVSYRWDDWKTEVMWMSLYFSAAVWISISLVQARIPTAALAKEEARMLRARRIGTNLLFRR
jgi:hypothetical protein